MNQQKDQQSFVKRHGHMCGIASFSVPKYHKLKPFTLLLAGLFSQYALADSTPDVYDVLLGEDPALPLPTSAQRYNVSKDIIRTAEASNNQPSEPANPNNKINTPNTSKDSKALSKKEGKDLPIDIKTEKVQVRAKRFHEVGPLPGLGLTKDEIPGNVQSITAKEIKDSHSLSITDLMNKKLQSVNVNDYQGNPFMMDVTYRGFTAGPQIGTPQGLSVFFDGIRVNEPFGDVVNWDLIPMNALAGVDVFPGSNPIFGLGTLGGAFTVKTKDGFNHEGIDAEVLTGSFGRKQLQVTGGTNNGTFALFGAGNFFLEDGWRDNSPSKVNQFFGKASYRGEKLDLHLSTLLVGTDLVGNGLLPSEQYRQDPSSVFTAPDTTKNKLIQFQISSAFQVNDNFSITGQIYNRKSDRKSVGADVYTAYSEEPFAAPKTIDAGDEITCLYSSTGRALQYGLPDYYTVELPNVDGSAVNVTYFIGAEDPTNPYHNLYLTNNNVKFVADAFNGNVDLSLIESSLNQRLPDDFLPYAQAKFNLNKNFRAIRYLPSQNNIPPTITQPPPLPGSISAWQFLESPQAPGTTSNPAPVDISDGANNYYYTPNGDGTYNQHAIIFKRALNADKCFEAGTRLDAAGNTYYFNTGGGYYSDSIVVNSPDGPRTATKVVDGAFDAFGGGTVIDGVPNAIMTNNEINQLVKGGAIQFNWNLDHHKFMVGASIDSAYADYKNSQQLGFLDAKRNVYLDPDQALDAFAAADVAFSNNNFDGTSVTKSIYASETWSPVETLHVTGAVRYNATKIKNTISVRQLGPGSDLDLHTFINDINAFDICPNADCTGVGTGYRTPNVSNLLNAPETEKYSYYSLNPSLGATWQATPNLNIFGNVAKGTRTPSVVELGCALDKTPILLEPAKDNDGDGINDTPARYTYKSLYERRTCSLPSTLSGDPYLPQIKATTYDIGIRGTLASVFGMDNIEWNLGAYRTDLKDDIYLVAVAPGRDFFDTIGKTRRQGIEAGFGGGYGKARFKVNYAYTDATFEDTFNIASPNNSSAVIVQEFKDIGRQITVNPGDRMPGVPLHNLNATVTYDLTPKWNVGLTAVAHSESFVRGNENNEHKQGVVRKVFYDSCNSGTGVCENFTATRQPTANPGKVPGYATFNFQTSYKFNSEWTASMQVNNLFDKEYFSAGRLGINPFSPSIQGQRDISGYNHNSNDWLTTNFIAPGAPRGVWFSLNWQFDPKK